MAVKAKIRLIDGGPRTHTARGRTMSPGQVNTITDVDDIRYYMSSGFHEVVIVAGRLPGSGASAMSGDEGATPHREDAADESDDSPAQDTLDEEDGDAGNDNEVASEFEQEPGDEPVDEEENNEPQGDGGELATEPEVPTLAPYVRKDLELLSKRTLIAKASEDGLDLSLRENMNKMSIVDAMMAANPPAEV